jgi:hypothetical protein
VPMQKEADDRVYHRRRSQLDNYKEGESETNPFMPEFDRLQREHDLLVDVASGVAGLGDFAGRHLRAAVEVSPLRHSDWGEDILSQFGVSSRVFDKASVEIVNDPMELVREPVLRRFELPATVAA